MKKARINDNKIVITFNKMSAETFKKIHTWVSGLPKKSRSFNMKSKEWTIECTTENYEKLREFNFDIDPQIFRKVSNMTEDLSWKSIDIPEQYDYLYDDQKDVFRFILANGGKGVIASDMGSGKSNTSLSIADYLNDFPVLIVCTSTLKVNWVNQHKKWIKAQDIIKVIESTKDLKDYNDTIDIAIINYQLLSRNIKKIKVVQGTNKKYTDKDKKINETYEYIWLPTKALTEFGNNCFDTIIIDEGQYMKGEDSQTTNAIRYVSRGAPTMMILTGTPILNSNIEIFPLLNLLYPDVFNNYYQFGKRYAQEKDRWEGKQKKQGAFYGFRNSEELNMILKNGYMIRQTVQEIKEMRGEEYFEPNINIIPFKPSKLSKYVEAEKSFGVGVNKGENKKSLFDKFSKMRSEAWELKKKECLEFIKEVQEESQDKIVLYAHNKNVISDLKEHFGKELVFIDGSVNSKGSTRNDIIEEFCKNKSIKYIAISIGAGAVGLDGMQLVSHTMIFLQEAYNPGTKYQCYGRLNNRTGQEFKTNIFHTICEGTVEELFLRIQDRKEVGIRKAIDGEDMGEDEFMEEMYKVYREKYK